MPSVSRDGIKLPWAAIGTLLAISAGIIATYVFVTKPELQKHTLEESERVTVIEQTEKHHDEAISELKDDVKDVKASMGAVEFNVRTMLQEVGVPDRRIARSKR